MAGKAVFLDTSGLYAWLAEGDDHHKQAVEFFTATDRPLLTTDWIVGETCNLFVARRAPRLVRVLFQALDRSVAIRLVNVGEKWFQEARSLFLRYEDQAFPLTDCTSFAVMHDFGLTEALTADRHFRTMGLDPILVP